MFEEIDGGSFIRLQCLIEEYGRNLKMFKEQWDEYEAIRKEEYKKLEKEINKLENSITWLTGEIKVHDTLHREMRTQEGLEIAKIKEKLVIYIGIIGLIISVVFNFIIKKLF